MSRIIVAIRLNADASKAESRTYVATLSMATVISKPLLPRSKLPYSPLASSLGLVHLPHLYWPILIMTLLAYMRLTQTIKVWFARKKLDLMQKYDSITLSLPRNNGVDPSAMRRESTSGCGK
jgi:hypothetical protein